MEWSNFEEQSRQKLRDRKIQPSEKAWETISEKLDAVETPRKSRVFWYAVAASFIGFLLISVIVFNSRRETVTVPIEVVETPVENQEETMNDQLLDRKELSPENSKEEQLVVYEEEEDFSETVATKQKEPLPVLPEDEAVVQITSVEQKSATEENKAVKVPEDALIDTKIAELIAQVDLIEKSQEELTEAEVDSLLRRAQRELLSDEIFRKDKSVDAIALLNEVEDELDQTFRDQIFEKLKTGFIKVRTAVADRNN